MGIERLGLMGVMTASLVGLAACQTPLPNQVNDQTRTGALLGAGVGAAVGALTADDEDEIIDRAVVGGLGGAAVGASIGALLDRQAAELQAQLGSGTVVNNGNQIVVTLPQDVLFGFDSASVSIASQADLQAVAASLNRYPGSTISVIGHTDNAGDAAYNQDLSERRASAVAQVLAAAGVSPSRIQTIGRGEDAPVASNLTPEGRAQNRRVEIVITPQG